MAVTVQPATIVERYKRYPAYRDSGVEWLGEIPQHWETRRLKAVATLVDDRVTVDSQSDRYIALEQIESKTGRLLDDVPAPSISNNAVVSRFQPGDVLFGKLRPYLAKVHQASFGGVCSTEFVVCRQTERLLSGYLAALLRSADFIGWIDAMTYGTKMPRASPEQLATQPMPLPPVDEQLAIKSFLDRETARIDALIAKKERLLELLEERRTTLITQAVTKGLDPNVPMKESRVRWLEEIPAHWDAQRIKWVAKLESGHTPDKKIPEYWDNGDIPWISLADTGYLRATDYLDHSEVLTTSAGLANSSAHLLPVGTVIFSRDATIGLCAILASQMAVSQHFIGWVCRKRVLPEYLLLVLRTMTSELERLTMGATVKTIGMPDVKELTMPIPPVDEQRQIVGSVRRRRSQSDQLADRIREAIDELTGLRSALISAAVTGKIDVREAVT